MAKYQIINNISEIKCNLLLSNLNIEENASNILRHKTSWKIYTHKKQRKLETWKYFAFAIYGI